MYKRKSRQSSTLHIYSVYLILSNISILLQLWSSKAETYV